MQNVFAISYIVLFLTGASYLLACHVTSWLLFTSSAWLTAEKFGHYINILLFKLLPAASFSSPFSGTQIYVQVQALQGS